MKKSGTKKAALKPAYERLTCEVLKIKVEGVLCGSGGGAVGLTQQSYSSGGTY